MRHHTRLFKHFRFVAIGSLALAASTMAAGVALTPGASHTFRQHADGAVLTPGTSLAGDPTLAGSVIGDAVRPFSLEIVTSTASGPGTTSRTFSGQIHDWVVRRADTGTLDFYMSMHVPSPGNFGGTITRPWALGGATGVDAHWRDDLVSEGNPPTALSLGAAGTDVTARYFVTDDGAPNWIDYLHDSAPVLFRSTLSQYSLGEGSVGYAYHTDFSSSAGSTPVPFYMPAVPEPSTWALLLMGLAALALALRRPAATAARTAAR